MLDRIEDGLMVVGTALGIATIKEWIGLALLIMQVLLLIYRFVCKAIQKMKEKKYNDLVTDIEDTIEKINKINEEIANISNRKEEDKEEAKTDGEEI